MTHTEYGPFLQLISWKQKEMVKGFLTRFYLYGHGNQFGRVT